MTTKPQSTTETLEPCPFCPHGERRVVQTQEFIYPNGIQTDCPLFAVGCDCGARGPEENTEEEAARAWNTRIPASAAQQAVTSLVKDGGGLAPERLVKRVCKDGFIDCGAHPKSEAREVEYIRADLATPASAAPVVDNERVEEIRRWRERFTSYHSDHTVALNRAFGYIDYLLERVGAAATAAPQQSETADYACDAIPDCGWRSTDISRPIGNGMRVICPNCSGAARFVGMTDATPLVGPSGSVQHLVNQWQAAWISTQDISRDSEADLVRRIEAMITTAAPVEQSDEDLIVSGNERTTTKSS